MTPAHIEIKNLDHLYPDGACALNDVSFSVVQGEALAVLGANGAGKSTLLLHLIGCLLPTSGKVLVGGQPVSRKNLALIRKKIGLVFQDPDDQLFMPTVLEDATFGPINMGMARNEAERIALNCLELVGMAHLSQRPPFRLSAGEKRAVAIATVLAMNPEVLAMDEPSAHLDPRGKRGLIDLLQNFKLTRIIATHDLELAGKVCKNAILLNKGRVVAQGQTAKILADESLMRAHGL